MGGSDQWGNITTGTELIRRKTGGEAFAITCPLVTRTDGGKFGKTEKGNVWLDPAKTSPYQFYQFWLNATDEDAQKWIRTFTFLPKSEIEDLEEKHRENPSLRELQKVLASEVTGFVHGAEECKIAIETTQKLFANQGGSAEDMSQEDLENLDGVIKFEFPRKKIQTGIDVVSFLAESGSFPSKGEARKMIQNGGVSINRKKIEDVTMSITGSNLLHDQYILVQKGKKNFYLVKAV
jgi:tyrosyl-tRNA synthetase